MRVCVCMLGGGGRKQDGWIIRYVAKVRGSV